MPKTEVIVHTQRGVFSYAINLEATQAISETLIKHKYDTVSSIKAYSRIK